MCRKSFVSLCLEGEALLDDIDDFVDEWHDGGTGIPLYEFLGFTHPEYKLWAEKPNSLNFIIYGRRTGQALEVVRTLEHARRIAARSLSEEDNEELTQWLMKTGYLQD